jgi:hypothetical protein
MRPLVNENMPHTVSKGASDTAEESLSTAEESLSTAEESLSTAEESQSCRVLDRETGDSHPSRAKNPSGLVFFPRDRMIPEESPLGPRVAIHLLLRTIASMQTNRFLDLLVPTRTQL